MNESRVTVRDVMSDNRKRAQYENSVNRNRVGTQDQRSDANSSLSRSLIKSRVSNPTRYSLGPNSVSPQKPPHNMNNRTPKPNTGKAEYDQYIHNLKNRYMTAMES